MINMNLYLWKDGDGDGEWEWTEDSEEAFLFNYFRYISSSPLITQEELESMVGIVGRLEIFLTSKYILKVN